METVTLTFMLISLLGALVYVCALLASRYAAVSTDRAVYIAMLPTHYQWCPDLVRWISPGVIDCAMTDAAITVDFLSRHTTWPVVGGSK